MSYSIKVLHYASQDVPGPQVFFMSDYDVWYTFNYYVFLVQGEGHNAVVDVGMTDFGPLNSVLLPNLGERGLARPASPGTTVTGLLEQAGLQPDDIDTVMLSHLHSDHVYNVSLFRNARYILSREGWNRHNEILTTYPQMVPDPVYPREPFEYLRDLPQERLLLTPDGMTALPGIEIKYLGGHTADSAGFVIPTAEGRAVLPGDTLWTYKNFEEDRPPGSAVDQLQCYQAVTWAREAGDFILPFHDPEVLQRHPNGVVGAPVGGTV